MSAAPSVCECRFCGEAFEPSGIKNHQTWCDQNPRKGVPVEQQKEHGLLTDADADGAETTGDDTEQAHPDQEANPSGVSLPPRSSPPESNNSGDKSDHDPTECPECGSSNTATSREARQAVAEQTDLSAGLRATFDATERYCNDCWSVWGGELAEPHRLQEVDR